MKRILFTLLAFLSLNMYAQRVVVDCLHTTNHFESDYHQLVEKMLLVPDDDELTSDGESKTIENLRYGRDWGFVSRPSFTPEDGVICIKKGDEYRLIMRTPDKSIWYESYHFLYDKKKESKNSTRYVRNKKNWSDMKLDIKVDEKQLVITKEQANALSDLLCLAIATSTSILDSGSNAYVVYTDENGRKTIGNEIGEDGETTVFFQNGCAAECWSPEGEKVKHLYNIAQTVKTAILEGNAGKIEAIIPEVKALTLEFRKLLPDWAKEYVDIKEIGNRR